jgi:hypothetical protein
VDVRARFAQRSILIVIAALAVGAAWARPVQIAPQVPTPTPAAPADTPSPEAAPVPPAGPIPHIQFEKTELDLGDVIHGQDAVATFTYTNTGSVPLHILSAKPG